MSTLITSQIKGSILESYSSEKFVNFQQILVWISLICSIDVIIDKKYKSLQSILDIGFHRFSVRPWTTEQLRTTHNNSQQNCCFIAFRTDSKSYSFSFNAILFPMNAFVFQCISANNMFTNCPLLSTTVSIQHLYFKYDSVLSYGLIYCSEFAIYWVVLTEKEILESYLMYC